MDALVEKVKRTIRTYRMIEPGDKVVAAVSGGADSLALLHLLCGLRDELKFSLCIGHLNHMARGQESDKDAEFVARVGRDWGIETYIDSTDVKEMLTDLKTSFQEGARIIRYRFLEAVMKKCSGNKIAVGHNADDQVETVMINLFRGSGLKGLAGMPPVRGEVIRPLLECSRIEIEAYLTRRQLSCRYDQTNSAKDYLRNKIRLDLLPHLEDAYSKKIKSHILHTSEIAREEDEYLDSLACEILSALRSDGKSLFLKLEEILPLHPAMRKRLIRRIIATVSGDLRRVSIRHIDAVLKLFTVSQTGKQIHLPGFLIVLRRANEVEFSVKPDRRVNVSNNVGQTELKIPGVTEIHAASLKLHTRVMSKKDASYELTPAHQSYLDFDKTGEHIMVRFFTPGDRFVPLGMTGTKKVKTFFIDEKIPREQRKKIPILTTPADDVIWIYGKRIAQNYCVTQETKKILFIEGIPYRE